MKNSVKPLVLITTVIILLSYNPVIAQLKLPVIDGIANDIKKVVNDYPNQFINLMGDKIVENAQSTEYISVFNANGAEETTVTKYSANKNMCSWQALMLTTESFEKAKQKFRSLFNQLNNLSIRIGHENSRLKGEYKQPEEKKKFTFVVFSPEPENESTKRLKIEILIQALEPMEWKVKVMVYDREREDVERGIREE
ncbi:MAG: hypothetical protein HZB42_12110 [Sphingobacteriales bacterium]|nr:hypothetical protein [Sphingobacteriales bacterium]